MARSTVYNQITTDEKLNNVNKENIDLMNDFIEYLKSIDRSHTTIAAYKNDLKIFFVWNLENNSNKFFVDLSKREISRFQSHCLNEWEWSPSRIRRVKATLSSLSNYIENILDDDFQGYRAIVRKIESPANEPVREKTVFTKEQLQKLLDMLVEENKYYQACALALAIASGRRKSELCRFKMSYFTDDNIKYGSLWKTPEKITTKGKGSKGKLLNVYVLIKEFKPYLDLWIAERDRLKIESQWLLPKKIGNEYIDEQIEISTLDSWARTFSNMINVDFYWHSLRHFFTSELSGSGLPDDVIKQIVGWSSLDMVSIYKDASIDDELGKYFDENGIKQVEQKGLSDL